MSNVSLHITCAEQGGESFEGDSGKFIQSFEVLMIKSLNVCLCMSKVFSRFSKISISAIVFSAGFILKLLAENV